MKYHPKHGGNDDVQTPPALALAIVQHFNPRGRVLEPCAGDGAFVKALESEKAFDILRFCEIKKGSDFFNHTLRCDWIVSNPPWSQFRAFLNHAMTLADNIVFLITVNHVFTKARIRDMRLLQFGIREILMCESPQTHGWPRMGLQLGAVHYQRGYCGETKLSHLKKYED